MISVRERGAHSLINAVLSTWIFQNKGSVGTYCISDYLIFIFESSAHQKICINYFAVQPFPELHINIISSIFIKNQYKKCPHKDHPRDSYITPHTLPYAEGSRSMAEEGEIIIRAKGQKGLEGNRVFCTWQSHCSHEPTAAAVVAYGQASQHGEGHWQGFTTDWGAVDGWWFWREEKSVFFKDVAPGKLIQCISVWEAQARLDRIF